ncbi:MAG: hypothetical protein O7G87_22150, partial [bacterium]|nr:hypothetical protein [bacterium]
LGSYKSFGGFRAFPNRPYEGEHYLGFYWMHNFRTVPFEILGLRGLAKNGISLSIHGGHGRTWMSDRRRAALTYTPQYIDRFHHELGGSINGLWGLGRIDFTKRLDTSGFYVGWGLQLF